METLKKYIADARLALDKVEQELQSKETPVEPPAQPRVYNTICGVDVTEPFTFGELLDGKNNLAVTYEVSEYETVNEILEKLQTIWEYATIELFRTVVIIPANKVQEYRWRLLKRLDELAQADKGTPEVYQQGMQALTHDMRKLAYNTPVQPSLESYVSNRLANVLYILTGWNVGNEGE